MKKLFVILSYTCLMFSCTKEDESSSSSSSTNIKSVIIGNQTWMKENLDVTTYSNGDKIPQVTNPAAWGALTTGAWCYYDNDPANGAIYGKLYNWYAVNDPRGLAPKGWHIPTDAEWLTLGKFLGGSEFAGGKMKTTGTTLWKDINRSATNESGFSGLPGGYRGRLGGFGELGRYGNWWTATQFNLNSAIYRHLDYDNGSLTEINSSDKEDGHSVRCIKN